jgi:hypothetical protein
MIPYPILELTVEQEFQLRKLADVSERASSTDLAKLCLSLQRQNFMFSNTITNLVKHWNEIDSARAAAGQGDTPNQEDVLPAT